MTLTDIGETVGRLFKPTTSNCDAYLDARTGHYDYRAVRYRATVDTMRNWVIRDTPALDDSDTIFDVGAGWTELDYCLRNEYDWRGRYVPIDGGIDGTDINDWTPPRAAEWFVMLEIVEHLTKPFSLIEKAKMFASKGIIISTPNPRTTDVLAMDPTHVRPIESYELENSGFYVREASFYGKPADSLFAFWPAPRGRWDGAQTA